MSEIEIFARADHVLADVVGRIPAEALDEPLPADFPTHGDRPYTFREVLGYQAYDEAWIPDMVAGRTLDEVGQDAYGAPIDNDLLADEPSRRFEELVEDSIRAVRGLSESDLDTRTVHYSYGDCALAPVVSAVRETRTRNSETQAPSDEQRSIRCPRGRGHRIRGSEIC